MNDRGVNRLLRTFAIVGLAALLLAGAAVASPPCGRGVIDDLSDNGWIDRSWNCKCLLDGLTQMPEVTQSLSVPMRDQLGRKLRAQCVGWPVPVDQFEPAVSGSGVPAGAVESTLEAKLTEFHAAETETGHHYSVPWEIVVLGIFLGCLLVLIAAAAARRWRFLA